MDPAHSFSAISLSDFENLLAKYPTVVLPKLADLDKARYETIPAALAERKDAWTTGSSALPPALKKSELVRLVEWKLSHGTFRPSLKQLVESNPDNKVSASTSGGFVDFDPAAHKSITSSLKSLSELKGVGPATASLLLSVWDPGRAPFFSDELFRWTQYEAKPGKGWDRTIKYTPKEYLELFARMTELRERLKINAVDAEKVAYVLGRRASVKSAEVTLIKESSAQGTSKGKRRAEDVKDEEPVTKKLATKATAGVAKRTANKPAKEKPEPTRGTRSSIRLKSARD